MPEIKAVLLDFGGVIYRQPDPDQFRRLMRLFGVKDLSPLMMLTASPLESPFIADLWSGKIAEAVVWEELRQQWHMHPRVLAFLRRIGNQSRRLDRALVDYLVGLRPAYRTAILTNAGTDFRQTFGAAFGLERLSDHLIISAEEGVCKPNPEIFHLAVERLGVRPEEAVFVDDLPENVAGAKEVGLNAFLHQNGVETVARLRKMLNLCQ